MRKAVIAAIVAALTIPVVAAPSAEAKRDRYERRWQRTNDGVRYYRGNDGRYRCKRNNGTTGLLVGGVGGALVGRTIAGGGDKTLGTVLGAAGGALAGRAIDRGGSRSRCR